MHNGKFQKKAKKLKIFKKYHYGFILIQNTLEKAEKKRKKKIVDPFHSFPMRNRKFHKIIKKFKKIKKYHYGFISSQNRLENDEKVRK